MFTVAVRPRFGDIDVLGHINNVVPAAWFEMARTPFFEIFDPDFRLDRRTFPLIMVHTDYDFTSQMYIQHEVEIRSWVSRIGTKSFTVYHEAWQKEKLCAKGSAVIVHYNFNTEKSTPIPDDKKKLLEAHLLISEQS